jgi:hypothetical protein
VNGSWSLWRGREGGGAVVNAHVVAELLFELWRHLVDELLEAVHADEAPVDPEELKGVDNFSRELLTDQRGV